MAVLSVLLIRNNDEANPTVSLLQYFAGPNATVVFEEPEMRMRANDPVFFQQGDGVWMQIGYVVGRKSNAETEIEIAWYTDEVAPDRCRLERFENDGSLKSVVATLLPAEKRQLIQRRLASVVNQYGDELSAAFIPLVEQTMQRSLPVIESGIRQSVERHQSTKSTICRIVGTRKLSTNV